MLMTENDVCKHNQTGFCKYRQQCTKEHVNEICNEKHECKDKTCTMRHPKRCKIFEDFGGAKLSTDQQLQARRGQANLDLENAGITSVDVIYNESKKRSKKKR